MAVLKTIVAIIGVIASVYILAEAMPNTEMEYYNCEGRVGASTDYKFDTDLVVPELVRLTGPQGGSKTYEDTYNRAGCHGFMECYNIPHMTCRDCLPAADDDRYYYCHFPLASEIKLVDCYLSFWNTTVVKHSRPSGGCAVVLT